MRAIYKIIFIIFTLLISNVVLSYSQDKTLDSLKLVFKNTKSDTTKIHLLSEIGEMENIIRISYWDSIVDASGKFNMPSMKAYALNNIGYIIWNKGDIPNGLKYFNQSLKISEDIGYTFGIANTLSNIGVVFDGQGDYINALSYYKRSLDILQRKGDNDNMLATVLNNIAGNYNARGDKKTALKYYYKSLKIRKKINDRSGIANSLNNIGNIYFILSETENNKENTDTALKYISNSLVISEELNNKYEVVYSLDRLSEIYFKLNDFSKSLSYAQRAMINAKELDYPESISETALQLKNIYKKQNNYKGAFEMYQLYIQMRDSINNEETRKSSIKQQLKYEYEKKASADSVRIAKEKEVTAVQLKQEKTQRYALYGGLILTIVFGGFMFNRFRITQKQKAIIEQQKELVEIKQKEILDSIHYAKRIQQSLLPNEKYIDKNLKRLNKKT